MAVRMKKIELPKRIISIVPRKVVRRAVRSAEENAYRVANSFVSFVYPIVRRREDFFKRLQASELGGLLFSGKIKKELFAGCKTQYAYDREQRIYSVVIMLNKRPRILTFRVGVREAFMEVSLTDRRGNVLEMLRQERNRITFTKVKG